MYTSKTITVCLVAVASGLFVRTEVGRATGCLCDCDTNGSGECQSGGDILCVIDCINGVDCTCCGPPTDGGKAQPNNCDVDCDGDVDCFDLGAVLCRFEGGGTECCDNPPDGCAETLNPPVSDAACEQPNPDDNLGECNSGCISCDAQCTQTWAQIKADKGLQEANNLGWFDGKYDLIIYQQTNKGKGRADWFQWYAYKWLLGKAPGGTHVAVNTINDAVTAIKNAYAANGNNPVNVVIVGHGAAGQIKIGEEILDKNNFDTAFVNVVGMIKRLALFGCSVAGDGKAFVEQLALHLRAPVKSWTGTVWASEKGLYYEGKKNVEIPAVSEWGVLVLLLLVAAAGTLVIRRSRALA